MTTITLNIDDDSAAAIQTLVDNQNVNSGGNLSLQDFLNKRLGQQLQQMAIQGSIPAPVAPVNPPTLQLGIVLQAQPGQAVTVTPITTSPVAADPVVAQPASPAQPAPAIKA